MHATDYPKEQLLDPSDLFIYDAGSTKGTRSMFADYLAKNIMRMAGDDVAKDVIEKLDYEKVASRLDFSKNKDVHLYNGYVDSLLISRENGETAKIGGWDFLYEAGQKPTFWRGKNLGTSFTREQQDALYRGDFKEFCIGDFWNVNDHYWVVADWDTLYQNIISNSASDIMTDHHILLVCVSAYGPDKMHITRDISNVGYANCDWRKGTNGITLRSVIQNDVYSFFGEDNVVRYTMSLINGVSSVRDMNATSWISTVSAKCDIELLSECMIFGCIKKAIQVSPTGDGFTTRFDKQLPLFKVNNRATYNRAVNFLMQPMDHTRFTTMGNTGMSSQINADSSCFFQPFFLLKGKSA